MLASPAFVKSAVAFALALAAQTSSAQQPAAGYPLSEFTAFGRNPGNLKMLLYRPAALPPDAPLVVLVHGCMSSAREIGEQSGWLQLAERNRFAVLMPETSKQNEPLAGCFRTWEPEHQRRNAGEPLSIREMISYAQRRFGLSRTHVFITGMSSGGHVTNVMLAAYPELFEAGAPQSSFPFGCAVEINDLKRCAAGEDQRSGADWARLVERAYPGYRGRRPRIQIWHGSADRLINVAGLSQQADQWRTVLRLSPIKHIGSLLGYPTIRYRDRRGITMLETVTVTGMGHAIAVDPGRGPRQCGSAAAYAADKNICAAYWIGRFFGIVHRSQK